MYWLLIERPENWETDKRNLFAHFGIPVNKRKLGATIAKGDKLVVYISGGLSKFSDIREAQASELIQLKGVMEYDEVYPLAIKTAPVLTLEKEDWIPVQDLIAKLDLTKGASDWRQLFRVSLRKLSDHDGKMIESEFARRKCRD